MVGKGIKNVSSTSVSKRGRKKHTKTADSLPTVDETLAGAQTLDIPSVDLTRLKELPLQPEPEQCANNIVVGPSDSSIMPPAFIHSQVENSMNSSRSRNQSRIISENVTMTTRSRSRSKSEKTENIVLSSLHEIHFMEPSPSEIASNIDRSKNVGRTIKQPRSNPGKSRQKRARKEKGSVVEGIDVLPQSLAAPQNKSGGLRGNYPLTLTDSIGPFSTSCLEGPTRKLVTHQNDDHTSHRDRTNRKRRSSLGSSEDRQQISPATIPKGILRLVNSTHIDKDMVGPSGMFKDACSPHRTDRTHISKKPRIEFKSGHDTRYFEPDVRKAKSRRHNGEHDLRITVLKKNANQAMTPIKSSSCSAEYVLPADSALPTSIHSEGGGDGSRLMDRRTSKKHPIISTFKRQHSHHEECSTIPLRENAWATGTGGEIGRKERSINFDSLTVINSLIDYIIASKEGGGQVVDMILSRGNVSAIFLEKMIKSKDFGKRLTSVLSAFQGNINLEDLTTHLLSEIVKQNSDPALRNDESEGASPSIPDCVWRKGLSFLKESVTEEFQSTDSPHFIMASQPCSLPLSSSSGVCANHQKLVESGLNISNSSILPAAVFDLETKILHRVLSKIVESNPNTLKDFHEKSKDADILQKFCSVSGFLKEMTTQALSEGIRTEANTIFKSLAERMILGTSGSDSGRNLGSD